MPPICQNLVSNFKGLALAESIATASPLSYDSLYLSITVIEGEPGFETLMYVQNIRGAVHCVYTVLLPIWHTGCHVPATKSCIFAVDTVVIGNPIVATVYKSCFSAGAEQVVQINGTSAKPKCWGNTTKRCCTCVITNTGTKLVWKTKCIIAGKRDSLLAKGHKQELLHLYD